MSDQIVVKMPLGDWSKVVSALETMGGEALPIVERIEIAAAEQQLKARKKALKGQ